MRERRSLLQRIFAPAPAAVMLAVLVLCGVASSPASARITRTPTANVPFQRGITVGEWGETAYEPKATRRLLHKLGSRYHVDAVTFFVVWMQKNAYSNVIRPGDKTARTSNLVKAIRYARSQGLAVTLRPYIDRDDGGWRGQILPTNSAAWFASYDRFVLRFARLARKERVTGLVVGSEMPSVSYWTSRWRQLVHEARKRFNGFVTYQANWNEADKVTWWNAVDAISISAYYPLTRKTDYSTADLIGGWRSYASAGGKSVNWFDAIDRLRQRFRKPVMFGEIGYRAVQGAATQPWETSSTGAPLAEAQTRAYEAAFRVWYGVPWFRGFNWWYASPQNALVDGEPGADHRPAAATLELLRRWYSRPAAGG